MLTLGRKGIADEKQPENEEQRSRKRKADADTLMDGSRKRSVSLSSSSSTSVSTISTKSSPSFTRSPEPAALSKNPTFARNAELGKRRRRSSSSSRSYSSEASSRRLRNFRPRDNSRNDRRRRCSTSPESRGRERHYHRKVIDDRLDRDRGSGRISRSSSVPSASESSLDQRRSYQSGDRQRNARKRQCSTSPDSHVRGKKVHSTRSYRKTQSGGGSRDRSEVIRSRRSMTPSAHLRQNEKHLDPSRNRDPPISYENNRYGSSFGGSDCIESRPKTFDQSPRLTRKERSLSPFSKRLALTQAMNMGR